MINNELVYTKWKRIRCGIKYRVRLSRNLKGIPFKTRCTKEELKKYLIPLKEVTPLLGYNLKFIAMEDIDNLTKQTLVEKHIISPDFAKTKVPYTANNNK